MEKVSNANVVGLGCIRAIVFGLAFEAAVGLGIYGVWQVWQHLR